MPAGSFGRPEARIEEGGALRGAGALARQAASCLTRSSRPPQGLLCGSVKRNRRLSRHANAILLAAPSARRRLAVGDEGGIERGPCRHASRVGPPPRAGFAPVRLVAGRVLHCPPVPTGPNE